MTGDHGVAGETSISKGGVAMLHTMEQKIRAIAGTFVLVSLALVASGRARIEGGRVRIDTEAQSGDCLFSPQP